MKLSSVAFSRPVPFPDKHGMLDRVSTDQGWSIEQVPEGIRLEHAAHGVFYVDAECSFREAKIGGKRK